VALLGGCAGAQGIRTAFESLDRFCANARGSIEDGAGDETRTRDINLGKGEEIICRVAKSGNRRPTTSRQPSISTSPISGSEFINPHRLFHGVWLPQWLEERPELSEKAKKLYAYLTYFAGGKGYAWPSFNHLAGKLHISRRYVIKLVQELSAHGLIAVTNITLPTKGHCTNYYRFLWHPWMQTVQDRDFCMAVREESPVQTAESIAPPSEQQVTSPGEMEDTSPSEPQITPLVIPSSPKENNKKRAKNRGKVPVASFKTPMRRPAGLTASPPLRDLSDATKIILERRITELRKEIAAAARKGIHDRAIRLHGELAAHQAKLGFTPDDPPRAAPPPPARKTNEPSSDWPSPEEVSATFNELRRSMGFPIKP
jgi:hypothetical protein